jgi:hypothetical protein
VVSQVELSLTGLGVYHLRFYDAYISLVVLDKGGYVGNFPEALLDTVEVSRLDEYRARLCSNREVLKGE